MVGERTSRVPEAELYKLVIDVQVVHVVLKYCGFAYVEPVVSRTVVREQETRSDALDLGKEPAREDVE